MESVFTALAGLMEGPASFVLTGAFLWGIASILLSPCHLASIPLISGYIIRVNSADAKKGVLLSLIFSLGIFIVLAAIGLLTAAAGRMMGHIDKPVAFILAAVLILTGFVIADIIPLPFPSRNISPSSLKGGYTGAFLLGLIFGAGLGPCAFAFMIPVLTAAAAVSHNNPLFATGIVLFYAAGHCLLIAAAAASAGWAAAWLNAGGRSNIPGLIRKTCGLLVSAAGLYLFVKTF